MRFKLLLNIILMLLLSCGQAFGQADPVLDFAEFIGADTTNFNGNLSPADDDVQKIADTVDDLSIGSLLDTQVDGVSQSTDTKVYDFDGSQFTLVESPADDFDISISDIYLLNTGDVGTGDYDLAGFVFTDSTNNRMALGTEEYSMNINGGVFDTVLSIHIEDGDGNEAEAELHRHSETAGSSPIIYGARSRGSEGAETTVIASDTLMKVTATGHDGTDYNLSSEIAMMVDGTPGTDDMPGSIIFLTAQDGANTLTEALRLDSSQQTVVATGKKFLTGTTQWTSSAADTIAANAIAGTKTDGNMCYYESTGTALECTLAPTDDFMLIGSGSLYVPTDIGPECGATNKRDYRTASNSFVCEPITFPVVPVYDWNDVLTQDRNSNGVNPLLTTSDNLEFRDSAIFAHSPADGDMELVADDEIYITGTGDVRIADGFAVDIPSVGNTVRAFGVNGTTGIVGFYRQASAAGDVIMGTDNGATSTNYHSFGTLGSARIGDATHTDGTNAAQWDASAGTFRIVSSGAINDIGWSLQTGANTACNTTCTAGCVFGWNTAAGEVAVACTDATADKCLCAGAS